MENRITLRLGSDGWMVTWHGTEAARIRELFGTTTLPTAFTANADGIRVRTEIEKRNPGYVVTFA